MNSLYLSSTFMFLLCLINLSRAQSRDQATTKRGVVAPFMGQDRLVVVAQFIGLIRRVKMGTLKGLFIVICSLFIITVGVLPGFAQSDNTLFTEEQVYNNLVSDASFESWSAGTTGVNAVPDGWTKEGNPTSYDKIIADKRLGSASLKITVDAIGEGVSQAVTVEPNTTYTVGFYYKTTTGTFDFTITGTTPPTLTGNTGLSAANWTYKSWSFTTDSDDTPLTLNFKSVAATDVFSLDGAMVTRGPLAPAFSEKPLTDTGNQNLYGDLNITGTLTAASLSGATSTSGTSNDTFTIDTDYNGTNPGLRFQTGAAAYESIVLDETNNEFD